MIDIVWNSPWLTGTYFLVGVVISACAFLIPEKDSKEDERIIIPPTRFGFVKKIAYRAIWFFIFYIAIPILWLPITIIGVFAFIGLLIYVR